MTTAPVTQARVRVFDRDGTLRGTFAGIDLQWSNGKENGALSFTAHTLEADYAYDIFDDAIGVAQLLLPTDPGVPEVTSWQTVGPPYLLSTSGTVVGEGEAAAETVQVTGVNALALLAEWQVLHYPDNTGAGTVNRRGPDVLYYGWMHPGFDVAGSDFVGVDKTTRASIASTSPRYNQPDDWEVAAADWIKGAGTGGLTLFLLGSFTVPTTELVRIASTADEEHKLYLFGEGYGGLISDESQQETGYKYSLRWNEVLAAGTYTLAAEMTTIDSEGGDGLDALSFYVGKVEQDDTVDASDPANVYLKSGALAGSGMRQEKDDARPGFTVGRLLQRFKAENSLWMGATSSAAAVTLDFDEDVDSAGAAWGDVHERSWPFGTPISQVIADLGDVADFDMAYGKVLKAYADKGTDLSATVQLKKGPGGGTLTSWTFETTPITATRVTFKTEDGFGKKIDDTLELTVAPRSTFLETQQSSSIGEARRLGQRYINDNGTIRKVYSGEWVASLGVIPGYDFDWGDTIQGLNRVGDAADVRTITWAIRRSGTDGPLLCSGEFQ